MQPLAAKAPFLKNPGKKRRSIYIFSKHLQWLGYDDMAAKAAEVGFDGVDLTVRPKGHVFPENVKKDLPKAIKAIRKNGLIGNRMTTAITDPDDPLTLDILQTASDLGITNYRMGWLEYDPAVSVKENIEIFRTKFIKLAVLNEKYGIVAAYQNHTGESMGGPVWDIAMAIEGVNPDYVGVRYDIRHATVEGGQSWPLGMKLLADRINSFDIKDFIWKEENGKWEPFNVQLGDGMVDFERYFQIMNEFKIKGDFTIHLEYPIGGAEHGSTKLTSSPDIVISAMEHDLKALRNMIQ